MCSKGFNLKEQYFQINQPSVGLKKIKKNKVIDTECLFGEIFMVKYTKGIWSFGTLLEDKYEGWVKAKALGSRVTSTHIMAVTRSFVYEKKDIKTKVLKYLPLRSQVKVLQTYDKWCKLDLGTKEKNNYGYVLKSDLIEKNKSDTNWIKYTKKLLSVPYRWGGRDSFGIDCSALLQLCLAFSGEKLPRDSFDQFKYFNSNSNYIVSLNFEQKYFVRGNIIYWKGHIAIIINKSELIHASGYHGKVVKEKTKKTIQRINKEYYLIKRKN